LLTDIIHARIIREDRTAGQTVNIITAPTQLLIYAVKLVLWELIPFSLHRFGGVGLPFRLQKLSDRRPGISGNPLEEIINALDSKVALQHGQAVEHDVIHLCLSVDHEIIDGAPLMRFADQFKKILLQGTALNQPADGGEDQNSEAKLTR